MDCALLRFDAEGNKLVFALANNPLWLVRQDEVMEFAPDKMPVGKHDRDKVSFTRQEVEVCRGDMVYVFTDGYADQFGGEKGKKFKYSNLQKLLRENVHLSVQEQHKKIALAFETWKGDLEQIDDVCVVGIRI
jgi:serine phosphatase RsbU (regulator of sigma subunit)